ncbi:hypothetical protein NQ156_10200 [Microbacterium sp. zg.Y625]|uniref:hypothetical protein n=1 Tax=Microbacterium jiangjiandongii TaxID=3049071 RepID=UPI00214BFEA0|nr:MULTISPECIES: hypothetical protein [unclassified Microbacterium]MCR2793431.1 hypothetical protein [Microbacterium sp. zg.Y625]WIM25198.1 hypothetical protein QNO14_13865 [Microbacterium sp. zg-Y625]
MTTVTSADVAASAEDAPLAPRPRRTPPALAKLVGLTVALGAILVVLLMLFIMPSLKSGAHDLPIGIVAASEAVDGVEAALQQAAPDAYDARAFASEEDLRAAIADREVVGGLVVEGSGVHALVASAGSAVISGGLSASAQAVAAASGGTAQVTDVVALPGADPTGIGIGGLAFPLVFGGIVPAVAFRKVFARRLGWAVAGIATFSVVGGLIVAAVLAFAFGSIAAASFWPVAAAMSLGIAALALALAGLQEAFGGKGFTIGAMVMMFIGNPLAGIATTSAWLPAGWGLVGQLLPPGATGTLVRSAAYFGGAGGLTAAVTLAAWVVGGILLLVIGARRPAARLSQSVV